MTMISEWAIDPPRWRWPRYSKGAHFRDVPFHADRPPADVALVTHFCGAGPRGAVVRLARYFRREFGYDFVLFSLHGDGDRRDEALVWLADRYSAPGFPGRSIPWSQDALAIGATSFRWREYAERPPGFAMEFIWLHPFARRQGRLRALWPWLRRRYGAFEVEGPLSKAMAAFLATTHEAPSNGAAAPAEVDDGA